MMSPDRAPLQTPARALLLLAFLLSGAAALAYEVAWSRALLLLLGSTAVTSAVVLGIFVGALGFGARWGGHRAERSHRPLLLYGVFELGAAVWAVLADPLVSGLEGPYVALAGGAPGWVQMALRVLAASLVIAPAAFLMGATLPAMVRHCVREGDETGRQTAWFYGVNTVGAVLGCLVTGYVGIEALGVRGMVLSAAAMGAGVGLVAALAGLRAAAIVRPAEVVAQAVGRDSALRAASLAALLCGFVGLGVEIVGFRILVFFVEGFTVTFASMLGVFVAGLGIGSLVLGPTLARTQRPARMIGVLLTLTGVALLMGLYLVIPSMEDWMHVIRDLSYAGASTPEDIAAGLRFSSLLGASLLLFLPALLLGPTFSLCVRWVELAGEGPGHAVGRIYLWNSLGSLSAPIAFTFLVIPLVHVTGAWVILLMLALGVGIALMRLERSSKGQPERLRLAAALGLALGVSVLLLDPVGTRPEDLVEASIVMRHHPDRELIIVRSDAVTTASVVVAETGERYLYTDDFAAAATGRHYRYMRMLGHLPAVLSYRPRNAMVIAFGTGTTAGAVARHAEVERLEVVEVSSAVLDLAEYFTEANRNVLADERVQVIRDDGRNALLLHEADLDLITLEPLMPYSPQGYPFYTREFYELARDRLREGGVLCQWIPVHAMPVGLYAAFLRAFYEVFPEGSLWFFEQSTILIGRKGEAAPDSTTVLRRLSSVGDDLREAGFEQPWLALSGYLARGREVLDLPAPPSYEPYKDRPLTDMDPYPEFTPSPRAPLNTPYLHQTLKYVFSLVDPKTQPTDRSWWTVENGSGLREGTQMALAARWKDAEASFLEVALRPLSRGSDAFRERDDQRRRALEDAIQGYRHALRRLPGERVLAWRLVRALRAHASALVRHQLARAGTLTRQGKPAEAAEELSRAAGLMRATLPPSLSDPDPLVTHRIETVTLAAAVLLRLGRCAEARALVERARLDLDDERRSKPLVELLDAIQAHADGRATKPPAHRAWVFADAAPCRAEGTVPIQAEYEAWLSVTSSSSSSAPLRLRRAALKRLLEAARREGTEQALLVALSLSSEPPTPLDRVLRAILLQRLDPDHPGLEALLTAKAAGLARTALIEAGWWGLLNDQADAMDAALASEDAATRKALASAAARQGHVRVLRRVVELLMDEDADVRAEAFSVFLQHRTESIEGYDPRGGEAQRKAVYERVKRSL